MYIIGKACDTGKLRSEKPNQDSVAVMLPGFFNRRPPLLVIADGMGGTSGGAIASNLVVKTFIDTYRHAGKMDETPAILAKCVYASHQAIRDIVEQNDEQKKMGSTVVSVVLEENRLYLINVGDSRAYLININGIHQISQDHSLVAELVRQKELTAEEAHHHPRNNMLTMAISAPRKEILPYQNTISINKEDIILLCSDGLWNIVSESQIHLVTYELEPQKATDKLVDLANNLGGPDNISVIIARHKENPPKPLFEDE